MPGAIRFGDLTLSALSHGTRFLANAVLLILLARFWAPEVFGSFAYHNAVAAILGLVAGWGLSQKAMRDAALAPATAASAVRSAVFAQLAVAPACLAAAAALAATGLMPDVTLLLPLFGAFALLNVAETMAAGCRGVGRFDAEALASVIGNGIFFVAGLAAVLVWGTPFAVACALLCARVAHVLAGACILRRAGLGGGAARPAAALRGGAVFAAESVVAGAYLQIDTVLVKLVLGDAAAGAYQAGLRFVVVGLVFAQSMGGIFIPALVARIGDPTAFAAAARRAVLAFAAYGAVCFAVLACFGQAIVLRLYGADYAATGALAPLFGGIVLVRCLAAGLGIVLMAAGAQTRRVFCVSAAILAFVLTGPVLGGGYGLAGMAWANLASLCLLFVLYLVAARRHLRVS